MHKQFIREHVAPWLMLEGEDGAPVFPKMNEDMEHIVVKFQEIYGIFGEV